MQPIALIDLDGTLVDYTGQMRTDLSKLRSPGEPDPSHILNFWEAIKGMPWLKARMKLIKMRPGWWRDLPPFQLGWDIFWMCREIGYDNQILTKGPATKSHAWAEKVDCVNCQQLLSRGLPSCFFRPLWEAEAYGSLTRACYAKYYQA